MLILPEDFHEQKSFFHLPFPSKSINTTRWRVVKREGQLKMANG